MGASLQPMPLFHFDHILPLPLHFFGLKNIPGVPVVVDEWLDTLAKLAGREAQTKPAKNGLTNTYTIGGQTATAHAFLYGGTPVNVAQAARDNLAAAVRESPMHAAASLYAKIAAPASNVVAAAATADPLTQLSLDDPKQFALSWTTFQDIAQNAQPLLPEWSATLTDPAVAAKCFWPTIASYGLPRRKPGWPPPLARVRQLGEARKKVSEGKARAEFRRYEGNAIRGGV